ncbi:uncharacterized protein LOC125495623 [Beta vulgaris subsp. vulgaris]|uniref:uncharacterized protein LOC125495623 n=1 Tax=Beta vulgaris subsp. vulgaris TaxID=3555 RepID=UPI0020373CC4|nr:uncharacterized protein LOC125495623 [Beta vulgaris subsp. vulgaris]
MKELFKTAYHQNKWLNLVKPYTVKEGYNWLKGPLLKVDWYHWVWNSYNVPKHSFIAWMLMLGKLKTRERLKAAEVVSEDRCVLCYDEVETSQHLFFNCHWSKIVCKKIMQWMGIRMGTHETIYTSWRKWGIQCRSRNRQKSYYAVLTAMVYHLWMYRNHAFWCDAVRSPENIMQEIKSEIRHRLQGCVTMKWTREDRNWLSNIVIDENV